MHLYIMYIVTCQSPHPWSVSWVRSPGQRDYYPLIARVVYERQDLSQQLVHLSRPLYSLRPYSTRHTDDVSDRQIIARRGSTSSLGNLWRFSTIRYCIVLYGRVWLHSPRLSNIFETDSRSFVPCRPRNRPNNIRWSSTFTSFYNYTNHQYTSLYVYVYVY